MLEQFICLYYRITRLDEFHEMFFGERPNVWSCGGAKMPLNVFLIRQNFDLCATLAQNSRPRESVSWQTMQQLAPFKSTFFSSVVLKLQCFNLKYSFNNPNLYTVVVTKARLDVILDTFTHGLAFDLSPRI